MANMYISAGHMLKYYDHMSEKNWSKVVPQQKNGPLAIKNGNPLPFFKLKP